VCVAPQPPRPGYRREVTGRGPARLTPRSDRRRGHRASRRPTANRLDHRRNGPRRWRLSVLMVLCGLRPHGGLLGSKGGFEPGRHATGRRKSLDTGTRSVHRTPDDQHQQGGVGPPSTPEVTVAIRGRAVPRVRQLFLGVEVDVPPRAGWPCVRTLDRTSYGVHALANGARSKEER
jgi:hypothetical protein